MEKSSNPFALVVLAGRVPETELLERKVGLGVRLIRRGLSGRKVRAIFKFLENMALFENREMNRNFRERIQLQDKSNVMGIDEYVRQEGIEIGMEKGELKGRKETQRSIIENLLAGTEFSDDKIASLANVSVEVVEQIRKGMN